MASDRAHSDHVEVQLISETSQLIPGQTFNLGIRMKMHPHWHTYWRNPGDSGIPTHVDFVLPADFKVADLKWPYPGRYSMDFLSVYGYEDEAMLLAEVTVPKTLTEKKYAFKADVRWLECEKVCIPGSANLELNLPVANATLQVDFETAKLFSKAKSRLPIEFQNEAFRASINANVLLLEIDKSLFPNIKRLHFFPYKETLINHLEEQLLNETETHYQLWIPRSDLEKPFVEKIEGVLVNDDGWRGRGSEKAVSLFLKLNALPEDVVAPSAKVNLSLGLALLFAFLGGIILNLMPCVFPVLSFKVLNLIEIAQEKRSHIFAHGAIFSLGVLVSFWALGVALIVLKTTGSQIGWGFHLQSPLMVALLAMLFFILTLNLFGVFEVGLSMTRISLSAGHWGPWMHTFGHGILATIVATPCTAPFMGAALGYALTQSNGVALLVFTMLGLGMSFPYLILSAFPDLIKKLPKPGRWMEKLKKILSVFLFVTFLWLTWVLWLQRGDKALLFFVAAVLFAGISMRIYGQWQLASKKTIQVVFIFLFGTLAFLFFLVAIQADTIKSDFSKVSRSSLVWEEFTKEKLEEYRREGHVIFLDFTAAWCLSCQVNEKVVFTSNKITEAFSQAGVKLLKADWTDKDEKITQALSSFGRSSIPLYVFYFPGKEPILLPEIITPKMVLNVLNENYKMKEN